MDEQKKEKPNSGRKDYQKLKPLLVYDYLMRNSDENNIVKTDDIKDHLLGLGISADRRSIYRDIEEMNRTLLLTYKNVYGEPIAESIKHAERLLENKNNHIIVYDGHKKGFYVRHRQYKLNDIRILAECVYAARFIDEKRAKLLIKVISDLVSEPQAAEIKRDALLLDRIKTKNTNIYGIIGKITVAMSKKQNKQPHIPEKVKFKYIGLTLKDEVEQIERRKGEWYTVSPYKLIINDGNYYLLAYDDKMKKLATFRVDRMKDVELTGEPRCGEDEYKAIDVETYLQHHFGMFSGEEDYIRIRALNTLLDTFVDRFGTKDVVYLKDDDKHFTARVKVAVSNQFFGWICGLGNKVQIVSPDNVVEDFKKYLDKIRQKYE